MFGLRLDLLFLCVALATFLADAVRIPGYGLTSKGKHFATQNGKLFFWQADTAWGLFHRWTLNEIDIYLSDRAAKGFNMILAVGFTQFG